MRRMSMIIGMVVLIAAITVGSTYAYFTATIYSTNVVTIGKVKVSLTIEPLATTPVIMPGVPFDTEQFTVKNTGTTEAFVRVLIAPKDTAFDLSDVEINQTNWKKLEDGYYYYKTALTPQQIVRFTGELTLDPATETDGRKDINLETNVKVEAIQAEHLELRGDGYPEWPDGVEIKKAN